jgi:hypothetical protein
MNGQTESTSGKDGKCDIRTVKDVTFEELSGVIPSNLGGILREFLPKSPSRVGTSRLDVDEEDNVIIRITLRLSAHSLFKYATNEKAVGIGIFPRRPMQLIIKQGINP